MLISRSNLLNHSQEILTGKRDGYLVDIYSLRREFSAAIRMAEKLDEKKGEWVRHIKKSIPFYRLAINTSEKRGYYVRKLTPWWMKAILRQHLWRNPTPLAVSVSDWKELLKLRGTIGRKVNSTRMEYLRVDTRKEEGVSTLTFAQFRNNLQHNRYVTQWVGTLPIQEWILPSKIQVNLLEGKGLSPSLYKTLKKTFDIKIKGLTPDWWEKALNKELKPKGKVLWWSGMYTSNIKEEKFSREEYESTQLLNTVMEFLEDSMDPRVTGLETLTDLYMGDKEYTQVIHNTRVQTLEVNEANIELVEFMLEFYQVKGWTTLYSELEKVYLAHKDDIPVIMSYDAYMAELEDENEEDSVEEDLLSEEGCL